MTRFMTELRIILLIIGAIILALIYYFGTRNKNETKDDSEAHGYIEPSIGNDTIPTRPNDLPRKESSLKQRSLAPGELVNDKIITLYVHAKSGQQFDWYSIREAAEQVGLEFGEDNIFHRYNGFGESKQLVFIVANMLKPGVFQVDMRTSGLVFIMTLPGVMPALDMWDTMFPVGERISELLGGRLTDENHNLFTRQRIASMREEMREFDYQN